MTAKEVPLYNKEGKQIDSIRLDEQKFGYPVHRVLLRDAVIMYEANKRQGTASTKTKGEVAGGGKKPWVQKHTGRARAGSIRSPLWRGGGVVFGPKPRNYSYAMPKKAKKLALFSALSGKIRDNELIVIDDLSFDTPKTKRMVEILNALKIYGESCLIVTQNKDAAVWKSARNIPYVKVLPSAELNAYDVLRPKKILITKEAITNIKK